MHIDDIKRGLRAEIKKRENEQYATFQCNVRQMCKDVLAKLEEQETEIAEMKKVCNDKDDRCLHTLKENRHHKYKRCLDKAEIASHNWHLHNSFYMMGHKDYELKKCERYERHRLRWLELAEKFKEAK